MNQSYKPFTIGFDASFVHGQQSGTGVYMHQLLTHLSKIDKENYYTVFPFFTYHFCKNFKLYQPELKSNFSLFWNSLPTPIIQYIWNMPDSIKQYFLSQFNIFHATSFSIPPSFMYKKLVVTIYDTSFYSHPQFHKKENIDHCMKTTQKAVLNADTIIAISENTKRDLIKYFDYPAKKVFVTYLACDSTFYKTLTVSLKKRVQKKYKLNKPFIFHLGSLEPRKNTLGLIKAYRLLPKKIKHNFDLVIAGAKGWKNKEVYDYVSKHSLEKHVKMLGYIKNDDLPALYQSAHCFAYPSFYEGFGIPPLEAMASGCPVLTSNVSSLPEVCGKAAIYCNPKNIEDISEKLMKLLESDNKQRIKKSKQQAKKFSWIQTARQTLQLYKHMISTL